MIENYDESSPSFYVSLTNHEKILHNCLLDTGDNHNLMPKVVMDELGLDITKPYHDLFSFDSRKVKCLGLIKDLAITLSRFPMKSMMMDIVSKLKDKISQDNIVQLPSNHIPKGLVPLENLFDHNDVPYKPAKKENESAVHRHNIRSPDNPEYINLSTHLSAAQSSEYCTSMKQFADIFAWEYNDLKIYDTKIIQHKVPLEKNTIPFKQKLRPINPLLLPLIENEIKKLLDSKIIVPLRYSKWIANLVVVRKKNGEIRLCVDFRDLNKCSRKENYPLPKMEHLLQKVLGARVMSFLDGFSRYNQIVVHPEDQENTTFTTPWATFMYSKMPFGLINAGATFHRAMDIAFVGEKDKFVLIYLDDITVFSSNHKDNLQHLKKVFLKCRQFEIYVNPKNS
eukprot:PITA_09612